MNKKPKDKDDFISQVIKNRPTRRAFTMGSHPAFFAVYFPNYVRYPTARFQQEILQITEDQTNQLACIIAFRGSGKSTLVTFSYSLWAILGIQQKKFVLIICQTQAQARQHMANLRFELENNQLLRSDLGPFREENSVGEWAMSSLVFQNTGARIMIASVDQSVRGIRHREYRPDLIILDDIEDLNSTKTMEGRNKTFDWFTREIIPLGDFGTRIIIVGNLLHEDCTVMRLKKRILAKEMKGIFREFPLLDEESKCLWLEKFDTLEKIEELRRSVANELAWEQEYLLHIISDSTRVIHPEWIHRYDELPKNFKDSLIGIIIGVDLAISQAETADYTAIVTAAICSSGDQTQIYILSNPVNKRMDFPEVISIIKAIAKSYGSSVVPQIVIETNGFQEIYAEHLENEGLDVKGVKNTRDKRTRLALTSFYIKSGMVLFPRQGAELLITQLTGFGIENHDDLADAFVMAITESITLADSSMIDVHVISICGERNIRSQPWSLWGDENDDDGWD